MLQLMRFLCAYEANRVPKGAKNPRAAQNEPRLSSRGAAALEATGRGNHPQPLLTGEGNCTADG